MLRSQGGQGVAYIYDSSGHLLAEHDGASGAVIREYIWLEGMVIAMVDGAPAAPPAYAGTSGAPPSPGWPDGGRYAGASAPRAIRACG